MSGYNIQVQLLAPMFVRTKMVGFATSVVSRWNPFTADADTYAKWAVFMLGKTDQTNGFWSHSIQVCMNIILRMRTFFSKVVFKSLKF